SNPSSSASTSSLESALRRSGLFKVRTATPCASSRDTSALAMAPLGSQRAAKLAQASVSRSEHGPAAARAVACAMRLGIVGAGRLGRSLAALAARSGHDVTLTGRGGDPAGDVVLLTVPDRAILEAAAGLTRAEVVL